MRETGVMEVPAAILASKHSSNGSLHEFTDWLPATWTLAVIPIRISGKAEIPLSLAPHPMPTPVTLERSTATEDSTEDLSVRNLNHELPARAKDPEAFHQDRCGLPIWKVLEEVQHEDFLD